MALIQFRSTSIQIQLETHTTRPAPERRKKQRFGYETTHKLNLYFNSVVLLPDAHRLHLCRCQASLELSRRLQDAEGPGRERPSPGRPSPLRRTRAVLRQLADMIYHFLCLHLLCLHLFCLHLLCRYLFCLHLFGHHLFCHPRPRFLAVSPQQVSSSHQKGVCLSAATLRLLLARRELHRKRERSGLKGKEQRIHLSPNNRSLICWILILTSFGICCIYFLSKCRRCSLCLCVCVCFVTAQHLADHRIDDPALCGGPWQLVGPHQRGQSRRGPAGFPRPERREKPA